MTAQTDQTSLEFAPPGRATGRSELILRELLSAGRVSVDVLSQRFQVNASTIRRDLERLERRNLLRRVHGGAVPAEPLDYTRYDQDITFNKNALRQTAEKTRIALAAARLIQPGDTIIISPGTTTTQLARCIRQLQLRDLTVVTNAVNIAMELSGLPAVNLIATGGIVLPDFYAMVGPQAEQSLGEMFVDKAFIGVTGVSAEHGLTGPNQLEALTYRVTLERARRTIVLADHTKLGWVALYRIAPITSAHAVITDMAASSDVVRELRAGGIEVEEV